MSKKGIVTIKKAYRYWKKNGVMPTFYACLERLGQERSVYRKREIGKEELERQRRACWEKKELFSILVPAYETDRAHFREMIDSVRGQTYPSWELLIADAGSSDNLRKEVSYYKDSRIRYLPLEKNGGISENTNHALRGARGSYIGLLDHDDLLEPDALYQMRKAIEENRRKGVEAKMLYSNEDKCSGDGTEYYEPHLKEKFNLDLILSNNYICHFLVMEAGLMKGLGFRKAFDGAQDHDLILRAAGCLWEEPDAIVHVPQTLYHWRCHTGSTAENPESKMYAYEAGRRAVEDFCQSRGWKARAVHTRHLGFFRVEYDGDIFESRKDLAAVGGRLLSGGRIAGGAYSEDGTVLYRGLNRHFGGYMHRAAMQQDVFAADVRNMRVRGELRRTLEAAAESCKDPASASLWFGREAARLGYRILWDPDFEAGKK